MATKIEWCDITINPIVGCSKCSPGCKNCYAEKMAARLAKHPYPEIAAKYAGVVDANGWTGNFSKPSLAVFRNLPKSSRLVFVGSMTDIFHDGIVKCGEYHKTWLPMLFDAMLSFPQHIFMLLTKRPQNMKAWIDFTMEACVDKPLPNLWLGVTVCNQKEADEKLPILLQTPAAKRFVSVEPMLGPINLEKFLISCNGCGNQCSTALCLNRPGNGHDLCNACDKPNPDGPRLDWVICGAETGPRARPMNPDWARSQRDQCKEAGVPFFFKKMGNIKKIPDDLMVREFPGEE